MVRNRTASSLIWTASPCGVQRASPGRATSAATTTDRATAAVSTPPPRASAASASGPAAAIDPGRLDAVVVQGAVAQKIVVGIRRQAHRLERAFGVRWRGDTCRRELRANAEPQVHGRSDDAWPCKFRLSSSGGQAGIKPVLTHKPSGYLVKTFYAIPTLNRGAEGSPAVRSASPTLAA